MSISKIHKLDVTDDTLSKQFTIKTLKFDTTKSKIQHDGSNSPKKNQDLNIGDISELNNMTTFTKMTEINNFDILDKDGEKGDGGLAINYKVTNYIY